MSVLRSTFQVVRSAVISIALVALSLAVGGALLMLAFGVVMSGILMPTPYVYFVESSPDRSLSRVMRVDLGGGPTISSPSDVYVVGRSFDERAEIGSFDHGGATALDGWRGNRAINVCMLRYPMNAEAPPAKASIVATTVGGQVAKISVGWDCPAEVLHEQARQER